MQVRMPNGDILNFPEGMSQADMSAAAARHHRATVDAQRSVSGMGTPDPLANGMLFGHAPELQGAAAALRTGFQNITGHGPGFGMREAYDATRAASQSKVAAFGQRHPVADTGLQIAGSLGNPLTYLGGQWINGARGAGLGAVAARSAVVGGGIGGITGGPKGAAVGTATGFALPIAGTKLAAPLLRRAGNVASNVVTGAQHMFAPVADDAAPTLADTQRAVRQVAQQMRLTGATPDSLRGSPTKPLTAAEAIGKPAVVSLGGLARRNGTTADNLGPQLHDRALMAPQRILDDFHAASGIHPAAAQGDIEGLIAARQKAAGPLFDQALGGPGPVWNSSLAALAERPVIKKAIANVGQDMLNAGQNPSSVGMAIDPDTGFHVLSPDLTAVTEQQPTASTWDAVKKAIGRQVERNPVTGRALPDSQSQGNYGVGQATKALTDELRASIPGYGNALDRSGDYLKMQDAFGKGQSLLMHPNVNDNTFGQIYQGLDAASQDAFKGGMANKLNELAANGRLTPRAISVPRVQAKLAAVLGPEPTSDFMNAVQQEAQMQASGSRMMPGVGSPSFEYLNDAATTEGGHDAITAIAHAAHNPFGFISKLASIGKEAGTTPPVRNEIGRLLMQAPRLTADEVAPAFQMQPPPGMNGLLGYAASPVSGLLGQTQNQPNPVY